MNMEDYIATYPNQYDPDIQRIISCKREFTELAGKRSEPAPKRGQKYSNQESFLRYMRQYDRILNFDSPGTGKCEEPNTLIIMFDGTIKKARDIVKGDLLMGPDSKPRRVLSTTTGRDEMFEVIPNKGRSFKCNGPHVLTLKGRSPLLTIVNRPKKYAVKHTIRGAMKSKAFETEEEAEEFIDDLEEDIYDIPLEEYLQLKKHVQSNGRLFHVGVEFPDKEIPIDAYMIGFWLGDGTALRPEITTDDQEIVDYFEEILPEYGLELHRPKSEKNMRYSIVAIGKDFAKQGKNFFLNTLRELDLIDNKHIPDLYKINSREKRLDLLAGLIDSDGYHDPRGNYIEIVQKSKQLADDIEYLAFSLGFMVTKALVTKGCMWKGEMKEGEYWRLNIFGEGMEEILCSLPRKRCEAREDRFKRATCQGFKVKAIGEGDYVGFTLSGDGRYLHDDFLVTHNTCSIVGLAEYYADNPGSYNRVYVLEKGASTKQDFRHQIVCRCTNGKYETDTVKQSLDSRSRSTNVSNVLKKWYSITTYSKFASKIIGMSDAQIKAEYSHCHIYIDEAHALRNVKASPESPKPKRKSKKKSKKAKTAGKKEKLNLQQAYLAIWRVCHVAESIKVVITTATPNINNVGDCIPLLNILLPVDRQLPPHSENGKAANISTGSYIPFQIDNDLYYDYRFVTLKQMEPFLRGILTYSRELDTGIDVKNMGVRMDVNMKVDFVDIDEEADPLIEQNEDGSFTYHSQDIPKIEEKTFEAQTVVYPLRMSEFQSEIFIGAREKHGKTGAASVGISSRQHASEFVFPDGSYGGNLIRFLGSEEQVKAEKETTFGLPSYVTSTKANEYIANDELREILRDPDLLWKHSCKFYEILRIELSNPDSKCFIFTDAVTGAGAILLALMFEEWGYTRYVRDESSFSQSYYKTTEGGKIQNEEPRKIIIEKAKRYGIMTNDSSEGRISSMMELYNCDENAHGEYIKIMIGSPVARDGINLYNVVRGYLLRAGWHPSGDIQALHRFLRAVSHEALLRELREQYKAEGRTDEPRITVEIYRMCSYTYDGVSDESEFKALTPGKKPTTPKFNKIIKTYQDVAAIDKLVQQEDSKNQQEEEEETPSPTPKKVLKQLSSRPPATSAVPVKKSPLFKTSADIEKDKELEKLPIATLQPKVGKPPIATLQPKVGKPPIATSLPKVGKPPIATSLPKVGKPAIATNVTSSKNKTTLPPKGKPTLLSKGKTTLPRKSEESEEESEESEEEKESESGESETESETESESGESETESEKSTSQGKKPIIQKGKAQTPQKLTSGKKATRVMISSYRGRTSALEPRFVARFLCEPEERISTDLDLYISGEIKDIYNCRMMRIWKILAINGPNNRDRNILPTDVDYSVKADYSLAKYDYWSDNTELYPEPCEVDYSTYDVLYSEKDIVKICNDIIQYLLIHGSVTVDKIFEMWVNTEIYREKFIWFALDRLFSEKLEITNRMGFPAYINTDNETIFLQNDFPFIDQSPVDDLKYYSDITVGVISTPITSILDEILEPQQAEIIDEIMEITDLSDEDDVEHLEYLLSKLALSYKVKLLEDILTLYMKYDHLMQEYLKEKGLEYEESSEEPPQIVTYIMDKFSMYIYTDILEPLADITETAITMAKKRGKTKVEKSHIKTTYSGRAKTHKAHLNGVPYEPGEDIDEDDVQLLNRVYLHTLYSTESGLVSYNVTSKFRNVSGRKRILKPIENFGWRDMSSYEGQVYTALIKEEISDKLAEIEKTDIYGSIMSDGKFRIHDNLSQKAKKSKDGRVSNKGSICESKLKPAIIQILLRENIMTSTVKKVNLETTFGTGSQKQLRNDKIEYLLNKKYEASRDNLNKLSNADIDFICRWYLSGIKNEDMCDVLKKRFIDAGRMLQT